MHPHGARTPLAGCGGGLSIPPPADNLTILRTIPGRAGDRFATKQWRWNPTLNQWTSIAYSAGSEFMAEVFAVSDLDSLARTIDHIRADPRAFAVRGDLTEAGEGLRRQGQAIRRRKKTRDGIVPTLAEVPRRWLMLDVDNWALPEWADLAGDPGTIIEQAIYDLLPEPFHDVRCFWQLSSSAGFKAGFLKVHLFFWLDEAVGNDALKEYLQVHAPKVDRAPFNAAQPHYIADPIVSGGHDPLPRRTGWIKGMEDVVVLGDLDRAFLQRTIRERREKVQSGAGLSGAAARSVEGLLALIGDGEGKEGFHAPLRNAAFRYALRTPIRQRDDDAFKTMARAAVERADREEAGMHRAADIERFCSDAYLDDLINSAFLRVGEQRYETPQSMAPFHPEPDQHVADARALIAKQLDEALSVAAEWHASDPENRGEARHTGLAVDVGTGKSRTARRKVAEFIKRQQESGLPHRVLWLIPTIKLGVEAEQHFADMEGVKVAVHRGREQPDPQMPGNTMCLDLEAVQEAEGVLSDVEETVCGDGKTGCPFFAVCGYQRQKHHVAKANVVIGAHELAFHTPGGAKKDMALTVFDEAWWQDGLNMGRSIIAGTLAEELRRHPIMKPIPGGRQVADEEATNDLHGIYLKADAALDAAPDGYLTRKSLEDAGLTALACLSAKATVWKRKRFGLMRPGMSLAARKEAAKEMAINPRIPRLAAMWQIFADLLSGDTEATGNAEVGLKELGEGQVKVLELNTRQNVRPLIQENPALLLDATMPEALVRPYLPRLEVAAPVRVQTPDMTVRQVVGGFGKSSLIPYGDPESSTNRYKARKAAELRDVIEGISRGQPGWDGRAGTLVVTYKDLEPLLAGLPYTDVAHFNDVAGRDQWGQVQNLVVIGRPLPRPDDIRQIAAALTGKPVELGAFQKETRAIRLADGTGRPIEVPTYADETAEAVRAAITDAEVIQAIGRARGVNRTADDPVNVWVFADVVTPLVVQEVLEWRDVAPSAVDRMACRGVVLTSPADAAAIFPDLFATPKAAERALYRSREQAGDFPPSPLIIPSHKEEGDKSGIEVTYRPRGRGQQNRVIRVREDKLPGLLEWLEERLGPLAHYSAPLPPHPDELDEREGLHTGNTLDTAEGSPGDVGSADTAPKTVRLRTFDAASAVRMTVPGRLEGEGKSGTPPPADASHWRTIIQTDGLPGD